MLVQKNYVWSVLSSVFDITARLFGRNYKILITVRGLLKASRENHEQLKIGAKILVCFASVLKSCNRYGNKEWGIGSGFYNFASIDQRYFTKTFQATVGSLSFYGLSQKVARKRWFRDLRN